MENFEVSEAGDILVDTKQLDWLDVGGGTYFKILRACVKTGEWALYVKMDPGAKFQPHRHQGSGQFFITKGELIYDVGKAEWEHMDLNQFLLNILKLAVKKKQRCFLSAMEP